ncbi:MAG: hypothetical protein MRECE_18c014 [Mycoplasmataceae bacterium CE_OT135]|nr:MAG: hypothetical protein MRECE_29c014 [Mycoplasmataceae bacterium CE_OT135]KLL03367.1 MAG: hypothetical protein MRECE_18c014 [Mycoplasmataceae bacterium CE_OT135]
MSRFNTNNVWLGMINPKIYHMESKNITCCEVLSLFASQVQKNITSAEEKEWFNDFAFRFFEALQEKDKLCDKCLKFLEERERD